MPVSRNLFIRSSRRKAIDEDHEMAVWQQKNLNGISETNMVIGRYEKLLVQFEHLVDTALDGKDVKTFNE